MTIHPFLAPASAWKDPCFGCTHDDAPLTIHVGSCFQYHGFDAPGGVALGFRLVQKAFACLAPEEAYPDRRKLTLFTSFPGLGLKDTMEMTTRMVSEGRYLVDANHVDNRVPEGVCGGFYFRFGYNNRTVALAPCEGYPGSEFVQLGRASKKPECRAEEALAWKKAKFSLANALLTASADAVIRVL